MVGKDHGLPDNAKSVSVSQTERDWIVEKMIVEFSAR